MFHLRQLLRAARRGRGAHLPGESERPQPDAGEAAAPPPPITLLAVSRDPGERAALQQIAAASGWTLHLAEARDDALARAAAAHIPLVILDRDLPDGDWRETLPALAGLPHAPCVLLASAVADEYLWLEISRRGGLDILPKPFQREAVVRVVTFAWSWRSWTAPR